MDATFTLIQFHFQFTFYIVYCDTCTLYALIYGFKGIKKNHLDSLRQIFFATRRHSLSDRNYMKSYDCRRKKDFYEAFGTLRSFTVHSSTLFSVLTPEPDL